MIKQYIKINLIATCVLFLFAHCSDNELDLWIPIGTADLSYSDNFKISGTVYDQSTELPLAGAIINIYIDDNEYNPFVIADQNGHYEYTGLKSWYKHKAEYDDESYIYNYTVNFNHYNSDFIAGEKHENYLINQNDYTYASYPILKYIDLENQTDLNHIVQNIYVQKIDANISVKATLQWDDGNPITAEQLKWFSFEPNIKSPKDGRVGFFSSNQYSYNETTGELIISNYFTKSDYNNVSIYTVVETDSATKEFENFFNKETVTINGLHDIGTLKLNKFRSIFVNYPEANEHDSLYFYYALCTDKNIHENCFRQATGYIENGGYLEKREADKTYEYYPPASKFYIKAFLDTTQYETESPWLYENQFNPLFETEYLVIEVKVDVFDVYFSFITSDFKKN